MTNNSKLDFIIKAKCLVSHYNKNEYREQSGMISI
ncbi:hypothetical protein NVI2019_GHJFPKLH_01589 [Providencia alcalifaciens]|nr:hypothetical protein NVI2019_GHJFPKLH_01589 [Providencia alcalifaciens]